MTLNLASLNVRGLRDSSKCTRLLAELKNLGVDVAAVQETHFTCGADCRVLESDFNVFSAYGSRTSAGASGGISSSPAAFLFLIFLRTESSSSCVNGPSLMSNCLLIILVIGSCALPICGGFGDI